MTVLDTCKYCGADIPPEIANDPDWDGETCSPECAEDLEFLGQQFDEWVEDQEGL